MTGNDWALFEVLLGREAMLKARAEYTEAQRTAHRRRMLVATVFYAVVTVLSLGAMHGFILLMLVAFGGVTGTL